MIKTSELESVISKEEKYRSLYFHYDETMLHDLIQPAYLQILLDFDRICKENNIRYNITAGTLLGAIREKGFIPWDDDIDVNVFREDYLKIEDAIKSSHFENIYQFVTPDKSDVITVDGKFMSKSVSYGSLLNDPGIGNYLYLDVLPIDNVPDNIFYRSLKSIVSEFLFLSHNSLRCYKQNDELLSEMSKDKSILKINLYIRKVIGFPARVFGKRRTFLLLDKICQYNKKSKYVTIPLGVKRYRGEIIDRSLMEKTVPVSFEGHIVQAPNGFREYLEQRYGSNYMTRPPKREQGIKCFRRRDDWKEKYGK